MFFVRYIGFGRLLRFVCRVYGVGLGFDGYLLLDESLDGDRFEFRNRVF